MMRKIASGTVGSGIPRRVPRIPVYGVSLIVMVDSRGRVVHVTSTIDPRVTVSTLIEVDRCIEFVGIGRIDGQL
jgi:hypothetical protein